MQMCETDHFTDIYIKLKYVYNNYDGYYKETVSVSTIIACLCSFLVPMFFAGKKTYGVVALVLSIASCILFSSIINDYLLDVFGNWIDMYGYPSKSTIKAFVRSESNGFSYFAFYMLSYAKTFLIILTSLNSVLHIVTGIVRRRGSSQNAY